MGKKKNKKPIGFSTEVEPITTSDLIDLCKFKSQNITVKVNNIETDLKIGDAILIGQNPDGIDIIITIAGIVINSEGIISYVCESNMASENPTETYTINDLIRLQKRL
jgi:hypothetical protein